MKNLANVGITHHFGGGAYAKGAFLNAGDRLVQHKHKFDHLSILAAGTVDVTVEGVTTRITGPECLTIEAGKYHCVVAVTNAVWYCIHATDCDEPEEVDNVVIAHDSDPAEGIALLNSLGGK